MLVICIEDNNPKDSSPINSFKGPTIGNICSVIAEKDHGYIIDGYFSLTSKGIKVFPKENFAKITQIKPL